MGARGPKSTHELALRAIPLSARKLPPPEGLDEAEAAVWRDTVATMPLGWFNRSHQPLLSAYCRHTVRADRLGQMISNFEPVWLKAEGGLQRLDKLLAMSEREGRAIAATARAMRLTHQSQILPRGAGRANAQPAIDPPWEDADDLEARFFPGERR